MRTIFHCDINNCFASIEVAMNPSLRGIPLAVCGNPEERRGIVLAKSEQAKACGVKTGDALWQAREKCPRIRFVRPHYEVYEQYSENFRSYLSQYTPQVEPFGLDECWMDVTSMRYGRVEDAAGLADRIRLDIRRIFGVTVSIGVSFNKVFAKLGSDLKKPDAVTVIGRGSYREIVWGLSVSALLGVGRHTESRLNRVGIYTIGQLAEADMGLISGMLGKNGRMLWMWANGLDDAPVGVLGEHRIRQSIGHCTTLPADVYRLDEIWPIIESLAERTAFGLQAEGLCATGMQVIVRDRWLGFHQFQTQSRHRLISSLDIARLALMLLDQHFDVESGIHGIGIRLGQLERAESPRQLSLTEALSAASGKSPNRDLEADKAVRRIQQRFGEDVLCRGYQLDSPPVHPGFFPS